MERRPSGIVFDNIREWGREPMVESDIVTAVGEELKTIDGAKSLTE